MSKKLIEAFKWLFLAAVRHIFPRVPLSWVRTVGKVTGGIFVGDKARIISEELTRLFPKQTPAQLDAVIKRSMRNFRKDLFEIWSFPGLNPRKANELCVLYGKEHLDAALAKGKGVIICLTHFGSWKCILPALGYNGYPVHQIAADPIIFVRPEESRAHNSIMAFERECEASLPVNFLYVNDRAVHKPLFKALASNHIVVVALDGVLGTQRVARPLLGGKTVLSTGPFSLAWRTGATLLPEFAVRGTDERHHIHIFPDLSAETKVPIRSEKEFIALCTERFMALMQKHIQQHPEHYARWLYTLRKYPVDFEDEAKKRRHATDETQDAI